MADGFLAPTGKFYPKTENFHAQTARAILGQDGQTDEPIQELLRRGYSVTVGKSGEKEIDFVGEKKGNKLYIQVTYLLASEDTIRREFGAYDTIRDNFPKYVVSMDDLDMSRDGIKHRNIRDFLQMPRWE